jgi:hypothetical protein
MSIFSVYLHVSIQPNQLEFMSMYLDLYRGWTSFFADIFHVNNTFPSTIGYRTRVAQR